ncbi:MAG TPA: hypothetical protein DEQ02_07695 [Ruminococcaceae bacterium]|nr:hypothetical protein [Oscillospiraceae bacterium]
MIPNTFGKNVVKLTATDGAQILIDSESDVSTSAGTVVIHSVSPDKSEAVIEITGVKPPNPITITYQIKAPVLSDEFTATEQAFNNENTNDPAYAIDPQPRSASATVNDGIRVDAPDIITGYEPNVISGEVLYPTPIPANTMLIYMMKGIGPNEGTDFIETRYLPFNAESDNPQFAFDPFDISTPNPDGPYRIEVIMVDMSSGETIAYGDREVEFVRERPVDIRIDSPEYITGYEPVIISGELMNPETIPANSMFIYMIKGVGDNESIDFNETGYLENYTETSDGHFQFPSFNLGTPTTPDGTYKVEILLVSMLTGETIVSGEKIVEFTRSPD